MLEFHIPYYALRPEPVFKDGRMLHSERLRKSTILPLGREKDPCLTYHEAKISFLVRGSDDSFVESQCYVDTYHGSEKWKSRYPTMNASRGLDPASSGANSLNRPIWNPRQFWLVVLARRIDQATMEWRNTMEIFDGQRMKNCVNASTTIYTYVC